MEVRHENQNRFCDEYAEDAAQIIAESLWEPSLFRATETMTFSMKTKKSQKSVMSMNANGVENENYFKSDSGVFEICRIQ